jgi:hypothetical protein
MKKKALRADKDLKSDMLTQQNNHGFNPYLKKFFTPVLNIRLRCRYFNFKMRPLVIINWIK